MFGYKEKTNKMHIIDFGLANLLKEGEKVSGALAQADINSITRMFGEITKMISSQME